MRKSTMALVFAVILAVLAVVAVRQYLVREKEEIESERAMVTILVAGEPLPAGERVARSQVQPFEIPQSCLLQEMVTATDTDLIVGKRPVKTVGRGDLILMPYFLEEARTARMMIPEGKRIATVGVNSVTGIAGLISPGDYVDVIWTWRGAASSGGTATESTQTLFTQVQVFSIDDVTTIGYSPSTRGRRGGPSSAYATVTLILYPLECELLTFAASQGEITLVKRSPTDVTAPPSPGIDASTAEQLLQQAKDQRSAQGGK